MISGMLSNVIPFPYPHCGESRTGHSGQRDDRREVRGIRREKVIRGRQTGYNN